MKKNGLLRPWRLQAAIAMVVSAQVSAATVEEIVVTAQKREQTLNEVGQTVTALTAGMLEERGVKSAEDLVKVVPGFHVASTPFGPPIYSLRGVGFYDTTLASSPAVTLYVDEVPLPYPVMAAGVALDVARVEVLKGPQGTLFGQNSTGGAINFVAAKPTEAFTAGLDLSAGRFDSREAKGFVSGSLSDTVMYRLSAAIEKRGDWQESYTRDDSHGERDFSMARLLVDWRPSDRLSATFGVSGWQDKSDTTVGQYVKLNPQIPALLDPILANQPLAPRNDIRAADWTPGGKWERDNKFMQGWARFDYAINDNLEFTSLTSYADYDRDELADTDGVVASIVNRHPTGNIEAFNQELRVAFDAGDALRWVVGVNYATDESEEGVFSDYRDSSPSTSTGIKTHGIAVYSQQEVESLGVFGNIEFDLNDDLTLKAGARYTETEREHEGCGLDPGDGLTGTGFGGLWSALKGSPVVIGPGECLTLADPDSYTPGMVYDELNEDNVAWRTGIDWRMDADTLLYFNLSKGYKSGAFPVAAAVTALQYEPVPQESVLAYEGGVKTSLFNGAVSLNAAMFYYDYKKKQVLGRIAVPVFRSLDALVSIPESSVFGQEISVDAAPIKGLRMSVSLVHLDATVNKYTGYDDFGELRNYDDTAMPFTPDWQASASIDYEWMISDGLRAFVGGDVRYQDSTNAYPGVDANYEIDSYTTVDLRAGVSSEDDRWRVTAWGRNVTDEYYSNNIQRQTDTVVSFVGMPATYGVTLSLRYD